jgi:hypothetical protein
MKNCLATVAAAAVLSAAPVFGATTILDPEKFVKSVYALELAGKPTPEDIYSPRLQSLFTLNGKEFGAEEVGRIDFDIWSNAQDSEIKNLKITAVPVDHGPGREIVIAKFRNFGTAQEVHFYFEKTKTGWKLDDARSLSGPEQWTLSLILKYGWDGKP